MALPYCMLLLQYIYINDNTDLYSLMTTLTQIHIDQPHKQVQLRLRLQMALEKKILQNFEIKVSSGKKISTCATVLN